MWVSRRRPCDLTWRASWATLVFAWALFLGTSGAIAQGSSIPNVFLAPLDTPVDQDFPLAYPSEGSHTAYLYVDGGPASSTNGTPCVDGNGEELCAYQLEVSGSGCMEILGFQPDSGQNITYTHTSSSAGTVKIVWSEPNAPRLGPTRVGALNFITDTGDGEISLESGGAVVGQLSFIPFEPKVLAQHEEVPEPAFGSTLVIGIGGLLLAQSRRRRSSDARSSVPTNSVETVDSKRRSSATVTRHARSFFLSLVCLGSLLGLAPNAYAADPFASVTQRWSQLALGIDHTCGIRTSGEVECFGDDGFNQVSDAPSAGFFRRIHASANTTCAIDQGKKLVCWGGDPSDTGGGLLPIPLAVAENFYIDVSVNFDFACAVKTNREIVCWGRNTGGKATPPIDILATEIGTSVRHACARKPNGRVACWGAVGFGQGEVPALLESNRYEHVSVGGAHNCAIDAEDNVDCWGDPNDLRLIPLGDYQSIAAGADHTCGVRDGLVECWGRDDAGETMPPVLNDAIAVYAGADHSCALRADASISCWGDPLAYGTTVPTLGNQDVAAGAEFSCGLSSEGEISCWGDNDVGQLSAPSGEYVMVDAGSTHACGLLRNGGVRCWGEDTSGNTLPPSTQMTRIAAGGNLSCGIERAAVPFGPTPLNCWGDPTNGLTIPPSGSFREVSVGIDHACAIASDFTIECWGNGNLGQLHAPAGTFSEVSAGVGHTCAVPRGGGQFVRCWGDNADGQAEFQQESYRFISTGKQFSCGLRTSEELGCWGATLAGVDLPSGPFSNIAAGQGHVCLTRKGGGFVCFGANHPKTEPPLDLDSDRIEDGIDNCPGTANADQLDTDRDGVGDVCDVCPSFADVDQFDVDGDGVGDRCDIPAEITLEPGVITANDATYSVYLDCGSSTITRMRPDILIPFFGDGSMPPGTEFGGGCVSGVCGTTSGELGSVVDAAASDADVQLPQEQGRVGALELDIHGNPTLCTPGVRNFIGLMRVDGITDFSILPTPAPRDVDMSPLDDFLGGPTPGPLFNQEPDNPAFTLRLDYLGDDEYDLVLASEQALHRVTVGFRIPFDSPPLNVLSYGAVVDTTSAPDEVPPGAGPPGTILNTHYFKLEGSIPNGGPLASLNPAMTPPLELVLMTIEAGGPSGHPVVIELEGIEEAFPEDAFVYINGTEEDLADVKLLFYTSNDDTDGDGRSDDTDNCPFTANPLQEDNGGFNSTEINFRGDACECGDNSGNGSITSSPDPADLRNLLAGVAGTPSSIEDLCSVRGGSECNVLDLVALELAFTANPPPEIQSVCRGAIGEPSQSP